MKKVLFIMHSMPTGGAERVLVDIMNHIDYRQYVIHLLLRDRDGDLLESVPNDVQIFSLHGKVQVNLYTRIRNRIMNMTGLTEYLNKKKTLSLITDNYDCIISFCQGPAHKIHQYLLSHSSNHISWVHSDLKKGNWGITSFHNSLQEQEDAYNKMVKIVFVSEGAKMSFNQIFKMGAGVQQLVIYNIVDKDNIKKLAASQTINKPAGKYIYINVGRLVEAKNQQLLLEAAKLLRSKYNNFEVWILGEGPLRNELEDYISKHELGDYVKLLGNQSNPYPYITTADAFVSTSRQEGFSMVLCEAICLCKPVVSTDIVGPREVLVNGRYGLMVSETPEAVSKAMHAMATDKEMEGRYRSLSEQRSKDFTTDDFMKSFYAIVDKDDKF